MNKIERIKELVHILNEARDSYYNNSISIITDKEYDDLFDELCLLEKEPNLVYANSPTQTVGYEIKSELKEVVHEYPLLSLDKTKDINIIKDFTKGKNGLLMLKLDGLTVCLTYENRKLLRAETRGNGNTGEDITHNAFTFGIPLTVPQNEKLIITGEAIITYSQFERINAKIPLKKDKYKTPRNLASGSVRQLDSNICKDRKVKFIAFNVLEGINGNSLFEKLKTIQNYGFETVPLWTYAPNSSDYKDIEAMVENLKAKAASLSYPIDGLVMMYDDIEYGYSLGKTTHHFLNGIAFKFEDEEVETVVTGIEYETSRYGVLTPVATFDPVELDGTEVGRASLHNLSIMENLQIGIGDIVSVYKANMIIPQIKDNLTRSNILNIPEKCPICGCKTTIKQENDTKTLHCDNLYCKSRVVAKLSHFVSKNAMNIDGFSESTIEKFVELGWLNEIKDIYYLHLHKGEMLTIPGFGDKSINKLLIAIEDSRPFRLENFLYALGIELIGRTVSKDISKFCNGCVTMFVDSMNMKYDFSKVIDGFGDAMLNSIYSWWNENEDKFIELLRELKPINEKKEVTSGNKLNGLTFVITGSVNHYKNREELKEVIESHGGKVSGSVSVKTSYLINNDFASTSGKNKKMLDLGLKDRIITEEQFMKMI